MSERRTPRPDGLRWTLPFALGAVPLAVWGFFASAVANRPLFAAWGVAAAGGWTLALRLGLTRRWSAAPRAAMLCLAAGVAVMALAGLLSLWGADLELGLAAVAPRLPRAALSSPWGVLGLGAGLLVGAGLTLAAGRATPTAGEAAR